jgi:hypothetical protein
MARGRIEVGRMSEEQLWAALEARLFELDPDWLWEGKRPHMDRVRSWRDARRLFMELQQRAKQGRLGF